MLELFFTVILFFFLSSFSKNANLQFFMRIVFFIFIGILWINTLLNWVLYLPFLWNNIFLVDNLSAIFLILYSLFWLGFTFYTKFYYWEYKKHNKNMFFYELLTNLFIIAMLFVIIANESITFLVSWEMMSLTSFFLVVHEYKKPWILKAWAWYFIIAHIWMFFILFSFLPFILANNSTYFDTFSLVNLSLWQQSLIFFSALIWFWSKAGLFPLHVWLPKAHPIAPSNISSLMSAFMVKLPVLMILKFLVIFFTFKVQFIFFVVTLIIAIISSFIWIFYALIQKNIKTLLAYSTIENIWIIFIGISISIFWMYINNNIIITLWLFATLYHTFNHTLFKWLMFMLAWWINERTWTLNFTKLWWLINKNYILWFSFLIWAIAIAWIFPLNWFNSELITFTWLITWLIHSNWLLSSILFIISIIFLWATAVLALITFSNLFSITFLWNKRDNNIHYEKINNIFESISYIYYVILILIFSILPGFIYYLLSKITPIDNLTNIYSIDIWKLNYRPILMFLFILIIWLIVFIFYKSSKQKIKWVWNCWYPYIEPKTQYTSISFIQPVRRIFAKLYSEAVSLKYINKDDKDDIIYKKDLVHIKHDIEQNYLIDSVYKFIFKFFNKISIFLKKLQNGKIEDYVFYMFIAIIFTIAYLYYFN